MSGRTSASFPAAAYSWITPEPGPLLVVGTASVPVAKRIARSQVTVVDAATPALQKLAIRWPSARRVAADITRLPFRPQIFSAALVAQDLSGLSSEAFPAYARALKPGGQLLIQCTARDDTVPWVRRLAAILQQVNPEAMTDSANLAAVDAVAASSHFLDCAHRSFRMWVPITKDQLLKQVDQALRTHLGGEGLTQEGDAGSTYEDALADVEKLYLDTARAPEPLLLPYVIHCWRAVVDHTRVRADQLFEDSLRITL